MGKKHKKFEEQGILATAEDEERARAEFKEEN